MTPTQAIEQKTYFSVQEANAMIPALEEAFSRILQMRTQVQTIQARIEQYEEEIAEQWEGSEFVGSEPPMNELIDRGMVEGLVEAIQDEVDRVYDMGGMIKGLEPPLVDWYAKRDGEDVFLCWKFGESEVGWWHGVDDGYTSRRPLEEY